MMSSGASAFKPNISRMRLFEAITLLTDQEIKEIKRNLASQIDQDELIIHPRSDFLLVLEKKGVFSLENVGNLMDVLKNIDSQTKEKIMKIIQAPKGNNNFLNYRIYAYQRVEHMCFLNRSENIWFCNFSPLGKT